MSPIGILRTDERKPSSIFSTYPGFIFSIEKDAFIWAPSPNITPLESSVRADPSLTVNDLPNQLTSSRVSAH
ncbi:unnamed protein product [Protopolystoma xenopodis]|uniref:Uncharacterized protein n=1 Tax=Protopolystoma xenopodis TaxID=117903 RepID=A0A448WUQ8_9PLAT|nr:unnamed protein product [Protopolystoma xenopodis]